MRRTKVIETIRITAAERDVLSYIAWKRKSSKNAMIIRMLRDLIYKSPDETVKGILAGEVSWSSIRKSAQQSEPCISEET